MKGMGMRRAAGAVLLIALLCVALFIDIDRNHIDSRPLVWKGQAGEGEYALQAGGEWYISANALQQAYGVDVHIVDEGKELQLFPTTRQESQWDYKPVFYEDQVITLMYHNVQKNPDHVTFISPEQFEEQLLAIMSSGFHFISMDEYIDYMLNGAPVPPNAVLITFDDGYESFYTEVYPVLRKYHLTATNFVIVETIDNPKQTKHKKLSWAQMREMKQHGMSFYSHTFHSHEYRPVNDRGFLRPMLTWNTYLKKEDRKETDEEYEERVRRDLATAEKVLKKELGNTNSLLAFPFGAYNSKVLEICRELDIPITFTVRPGINGRNNRNGFRINGGNQQIATPKLIEQMRNRGAHTKVARVKPSRIVTWNGAELVLAVPPLVKNGKWYIALNDLQHHFRLSYEMRDADRSIELFLGQYSGKGL
ncbi:polysaccharide deacetylase family protein [Paenibacillus thiaminolyticus]|uniref:Polysaccharide deacetylase family protein n=2 Tax=Paenibacillus thiaminolyticus TaxID=49283 RepID=A0AAP9DVJ7_PANTH|nr:polysaccharide deacetylase family protein [Paenibacillus thiaminolyticus]